jgi:hypothetical protein|eukprot:COSAG03_NODE_286_length_9393_cov_7.458145_7_plen_129_part_00
MVRPDLVGNDEHGARPPDVVVISSIRPGSPASRQVGLVPGLLLESVQVCPCVAAFTWPTASAHRGLSTYFSIHRNQTQHLHSVVQKSRLTVTCGGVRPGRTSGVHGVLGSLGAHQGIIETSEFALASC